MTTFKSSEKRIEANRSDVYRFVSDIKNFNNLVPEGKIRDFEAEEDRCRFHIDGIGRVGIHIASKEPEREVLFESEGQVPFRFNLRIDLEEPEPGTTIMQLVLNADLNMMMKMLARKPLTEGVEKVASGLSDHLNRQDWA